ncbi:hypothetical protein SCHPADRAFT_181380 [Schizopora paradoxa]|uniref:MYND-type domain-containing protein n=1 Tax=Schizopora paradoxa TaxID=27342 RepID=A0A0H2RZS1_9AGAM|nr:hypothetical protein SCHPADRAFT_181380 [Schizopora paradoxa]
MTDMSSIWIEAMNDGILRCLYDLSSSFHLLDGEHQESALSLMHKLIIHLSIASVPPRVAEELERLHFGTSIDNVDLKAGNEMVKKFELLGAVALERLVLKNLREVQDKDELAFCDNSKCVRVGLRSDFKKCGGCKFTLYCSGACQSGAWKGHKTYCSSLRFEKRFENPLDLPENRFPRKIATSEVKRHLTSIIALAMRTHPNTPIAHIGYQINVSVFPLQISAFRVEQYANFKRAGPDSLTARVVEVAKDVLRKADWNGEYQPTMLLIIQQTHTFACVVPFRRADVKMAEYRVARGDIPRVSGVAPDFIRCEDKVHNPLSLSEDDEIQEIVRLIKLRPGKESFWHTLIIREVIEDYLAGVNDWKSSPTFHSAMSEELALVLYRGGMGR